MHQSNNILENSHINFKSNNNVKNMYTIPPSPNWETTDYSFGTSQSSKSFNFGPSPQISASSPPFPTTPPLTPPISMASPTFPYNFSNSTILNSNNTTKIDFLLNPTPPPTRETRHDDIITKELQHQQNSVTPAISPFLFPRQQPISPSLIPSNFPIKAPSIPHIPPIPPITQNLHHSASSILSKRSYNDLSTTPPPISPNFLSVQASPPQVPPCTTTLTSSNPPLSNSNVNNSNQNNLNSHENNNNSNTPRKKRANKKKLKSELIIEKKFLRMKQSDAAFHLGFSPSTFSKRWRNSLPDRKWPYRKHFKLQNSIKDLKALQKRGFDVSKDLETLVAEKRENLHPATIHYCEKDILARHRGSADNNEEEDSSGDE